MTGSQESGESSAFPAAGASISRATGKSEPATLTRTSDYGESNPTSAERPVLAFEVGGQRYGLPVKNVIQIIEMVAVDRLPAAPAFVIGVMDYHGQVIPVVDLRSRFGQPARQYTLRTPIIVSLLDGRTVGLVVDRVSDVISLRHEQVEMAGQIVSEPMMAQTHYLTGVARLAGGLLILLDPPALFTAEEAKEVDRARPRRRRSSRKKQPAVQSD